MVHIGDEGILRIPPLLISDVGAFQVTTQLHELVLRTCSFIVSRLFPGFSSQVYGQIASFVPMLPSKAQSCRRTLLVNLFIGNLILVDKSVKFLLLLPHLNS
jgi:hypothetical protein